jgi:hypothetical protein
LHFLLGQNIIQRRILGFHVGQQVRLRQSMQAIPTDMKAKNPPLRLRQSMQAIPTDMKAKNPPLDAVLPKEEIQVTSTAPHLKRALVRP